MRAIDFILADSVYYFILAVPLPLLWKVIEFYDKHKFSHHTGYNHFCFTEFYHFLFCSFLLSCLLPQVTEVYACGISGLSWHTCTAFSPGKFYYEHFVNIYPFLLLQSQSLTYKKVKLPRCNACNRFCINEFYRLLFRSFVYFGSSLRKVTESYIQIVRVFVSWCNSLSFLSRTLSFTVWYKNECFEPQNTFLLTHGTSFRSFQRLPFERHRCKNQHLFSNAVQQSFYSSYPRLVVIMSS